MLLQDRKVKFASGPKLVCFIEPSQEPVAPPTTSGEGREWEGVGWPRPPPQVKGGNGRGWSERTNERVRTGTFRRGEEEGCGSKR